MELIRQKKSNQLELPFKVRAAGALGVSIIADVFDYIGAPLFALPIAGDVVDAVVMAILYRLTGSKTSTAINAIEFIPVIGDMIPVYTLSTLLWILREASRKRKDNENSLLLNESNHTGSITRINDHIDHQNIISNSNSTTKERLRTKAMCRYVIFRSRAR
ncbi:MAG: hypothetical protein M3298_05880 [Thermoproteota archaeon]|jgi:hypothetical protein|nr:hypothetical protein [Thermoproteota archaeon]MDQ3807680.1 hypothetical protein [Thermoproteota archaeon]MDQ5842458.1 hypothetical protein [Thermoproteota archaeon]